MIKVTSPKGKSGIMLETLIDNFEKEFKGQPNDQEYYHLVILGEFLRKYLDEIEKIYKKAGWKDAVCKTSSEREERPGLTGLQLWV